MNKKGEIGIGMLLSIAVGIIVALVIFQASAVGIGQATTSQTMNQTFVSPAVNATIDLKGQELLSIPHVEWNNTLSNITTTIATGNYTITERISATDGLKRIQLQVLDPAATATPTLSARTWRISYTFGPEGYIDDAGARSIAGIILLLAAIAIAIYALSGARRLD